MITGKSILITDAQFELNDPDYYEWETHIFFDDAMEPTDDGLDFQPNQVGEGVHCTGSLCYLNTSIE